MRAEGCRPSELWASGSCPLRARQPATCWVTMEASASRPFQGQALPGPGWGWHWGGEGGGGGTCPPTLNRKPRKGPPYGFKSAFGKMVTHGPVEIRPFLSPRRVICFATQGLGRCRMNQKCKPENSQPALLKVRGQANSSRLPLSAERLESQSLPILAQGAQESRKTSLSLSPHLENGG